MNQLFASTQHASKQEVKETLKELRRASAILSSVFDTVETETASHVLADLWYSLQQLQDQILILEEVGIAATLWKWVYGSRRRKTRYWPERRVMSHYCHPEEEGVSVQSRTPERHQKKGREKKARPATGASLQTLDLPEAQAAPTPPATPTHHWIAPILSMLEEVDPFLAARLPDYLPLRLQVQLLFELSETVGLQEVCQRHDVNYSLMERLWGSVIVCFSEGQLAAFLIVVITLHRMGYGFPVIAEAVGVPMCVVITTLRNLQLDLGGGTYVVDRLKWSLSEESAACRAAWLHERGISREAIRLVLGLRDEQLPAYFA